MVLSEDRRVTSQDGNRLSLNDSRYQQEMCPWGKENGPDRLGVELYKAGVPLPRIFAYQFALIIADLPGVFFLRYFRSVFSSPHFESISTISTERKARRIFREMMLGFRSLLAIMPGR